MYFCACASTIFVHNFVYKINCVHSEGLHEYILSPLLAQSRVWTMGVTPMSHLLEKAFTNSQLQDASPE